MPDYQPYTTEMPVLTHDLDAWDRLRTSSILRYLEGVAWEASAAAGFGAAWYDAEQTAWVIRRMTLQRLGPAEYRERLAVTTWIGGWARIRANREYEVRRADGTPVAVAQGEWVYLDRVRRLPRAIPSRVLEVFSPLGPSPLLTASATPPGPVTAEAAHTVTRQAQRYEADSMGHVNNTIYADWLEEAAGDALRAEGTNLAAPAQAGLVLDLQAITLHYLKEVVPGDTVTIRTGLTAATTDAPFTLRQEIRRGAADEVLLRAESVYRLRRYLGGDAP